jgi:hypothetical protein
VSNLFLFVLLFCTCAGIIAELITIAVPGKIISITEKNPEELLQKSFYKLIFLLSTFYMAVVLLLLFSGIRRFQVYGLVIFVISLSGWLFRAKLKKHDYLIVVESTICLILLLDIARSVINNFLSMV